MFICVHLWLSPVLVASHLLNPHRQTAAEFFRDFHSRGILHEKQENQFFDPKAKKFLPDRYVEGTCPVCGKHYVKTTYHKVFDKTKCRERYWNFADEERWKATQLR